MPAARYICLVCLVLLGGACPLRVAAAENDPVRAIAELTDPATLKAIDPGGGEIGRRFLQVLYWMRVAGLQNIDPASALRRALSDNGTDIARAELMRLALLRAYRFGGEEGIFPDAANLARMKRGEAPVILARDSRNRGASAVPRPILSPGRFPEYLSEMANWELAAGAQGPGWAELNASQQTLLAGLRALPPMEAHLAVDAAAPPPEIEIPFFHHFYVARQKDTDLKPWVGREAALRMDEQNQARLRGHFVDYENLRDLTFYDAFGYPYVLQVPTELPINVEKAKSSVLRIRNFLPAETVDGNVFLVLRDEAFDLWISDRTLGSNDVFELFLVPVPR